MTYAMVAIIGVITAFMGMAIEIADGNITHVRNGREPNAGAAISPSIPFVPGLMVGASWLLDLGYSGLGMWVVVGLFAMWALFWWCNLRKLHKELALLQAGGDT
jgi:hypothetical protein